MYLKPALTLLLAACLSTAGAETTDTTQSVNPSPSPGIAESPGDATLQLNASFWRRPEIFPAVSLRGYGSLSGSFWQGGSDASVLVIQCESADKAKLTHAKYLSDLAVLPGVRSGKIVSGGVELVTMTVENQGAIVALTSGRQVFILSARNPAQIGGLLQRGIQGDLKKAVSSASVEVPMYLNRWDKFGFQVSCRPLEAPKGSTFQTYGVLKEFDWRVSQDKIGFLSWCWTDCSDTAEGFVSEHFWDWGYNAARDRGLSVEINLATAFGHGTQLWLSNRYPEEMSQRMPGYVGSVYEPLNSGGAGVYPSWNSQTALDIQLAEMQQSVRRFAKDPNVIAWQEPHSELRHNASDMLREYGEVPDRSFREWLQNKYKTPAAVGQRWKGKGQAFHSWKEIHVPELASFLGWGPDAFDLTGPWRVSYPEIKPVKNQPIPFPSEPLAANFDDGSWPEVMIPGHDHAMFLPYRKPAMFRRTFELPGSWLKAHPKVWLYLFDMNQVWDQNVIVTLNGREVGRSLIRKYDAHSGWYEVTSALNEGTNKLAVALPGGGIAYRAYLSGFEPREYPNLGMEQNARWADYVDWMDDARVQGVRRGVEMIRQVDPDRAIYLASPGGGASGLTSLARVYGCDFHDTGSMSGAWWDYLPSLMAGAGLPFSLEPGNGFEKKQDVASFLGHWATEGIQSIDYIQTVDEIIGHDDIRKEFEEHLNDWHLFGKYHVPDAEWATLYSSRVNNLLLFPWGGDHNLILPGGHPFWTWISDLYPRVGVTDNDLMAGHGDKYRVIIDSNISIMDQDMIDAIERYIRQGGIFVTYVQTGRHTSIRKDAWPISKLTGYSVTGIDPLDGKDNAKTRNLHVLPGQDIFPVNQWPDAKAFLCANGLSLKKESPECRNLMQWDDGSIAAGIRPLGKGYIIDLGVKFSNNKIWSGNRDATDRLFNNILQWAKLQREPAELDHLAAASAPDPSSMPARMSEFDLFHRPGDTIKFRHYISNNGLYDVWALWNMKNQAIAGSIHFTDGAPGSGVEVKTGKPCPVSVRADGSRELVFQLSPGETKNFLTPRGQITAASRGWFALQRSWWSGNAVPPKKSLPSLESIRKHTLALDGPWAQKPLGTADDPAALASPDVDDSGWDHAQPDLTASALPDKTAPPRRILLRRRFTVPADWNKGEVTLWIQSWTYRTLWDKGQVYCDGKLIRDWGDGVAANAFGRLFKPGTSHLLAIEIESQSCFLGVAGNVWLSYAPDPLGHQDLTGSWEASDDALRFNRSVTLPGPWNTWMARRHFILDSSHKGQNVFLHMEGTNSVSETIINGHCISGYPKPGEKLNLNITNRVRFGQDNEIEVVGGGKGNGKEKLEKLSLDFYSPGTN